MKEQSIKNNIYKDLAPDWNDDNRNDLHTDLNKAFIAGMGNIPVITYDMAGVIGQSGIYNVGSYFINPLSSSSLGFLPNKSKYPSLNLWGSVSGAMRFSAEEDIQSKEDFVLVYPVLHKNKNLEIKVKGEIICYLNLKYQRLFDSIISSLYILDLKENFDDEGSKGYLQETWIKAIKFICDLNALVAHYNINLMKVPKIFHGENGSIDILWKETEFQMLINIPEESNLASYYGENLDGNHEGSFNVTTIKNNKGIYLLLSLL